MSKVWFITGASRGFGRAWTIAALQRGDRVAATARDVSTLDDVVAEYGDAVLALELDVTDRAAGIAAVQRAHEYFERLDVVVNNAGYGHFGCIEELTEADIRAQLDTNLFGALWITQAAIPIMRTQGSGHIIQISSVGGVAAFPMLGAYHASKWALEGMSEALAQEVAEFGIAVTIIEPAGFATDWGGSSAIRSDSLPHYQAARDARAAGAARATPPAEATTAALFAVVDAEHPPLRLLLSTHALTLATKAYGDRLAVWEAWADVTRSADGVEPTA
ncbi:MAG: SDR family NAD(P)-dependent oxidoreductase [Candidatus Nanopelagicales bacterium]|nr:SDR family NAD(P)-dependent oxidoreductase [Candidatus Nanopelagicales bacterium]